MFNDKAEVSSMRGKKSKRWRKCENPQLGLCTKKRYQGRGNTFHLFQILFVRKIWVLASVFAPKMETKGKDIISCFYSEIMLYHFIHKYDAWATQKVLSRKQKCIFFSFEVVTLYPCIALFEHLNHSSWYHLSCSQFVVSHRSVSPKHLLNMDGS